jgi:hypothetical protein
MTNAFTIHLSLSEISMLNELCRIEMNSHSEVIAKLIRAEHKKHSLINGEEFLSQLAGAIAEGAKKR